MNALERIAAENAADHLQNARNALRSTDGSAESRMAKARNELERAQSFISALLNQA